jgi:hypothetical protein
MSVIQNDIQTQPDDNHSIAVENCLRVVELVWSGTPRRSSLKQYGSEGRNSVYGYCIKRDFRVQGKNKGSVKNVIKLQIIVVLLLLLL